MTGRAKYELLNDIATIRKSVGRTRFADTVSGSPEDTADKLSNLESAFGELLSLFEEVIQGDD